MKRTILYEVVQKEVISGDYIDLMKYNMLDPSKPLNWVEGTQDMVISDKYERIRLPVKSFMRNCNSKVQYYAFSQELQEIVDCLINEQAEISWKQGKDFGYDQGVKDTQKAFSKLGLFERIKKALKGEL